REEEPSCRFSTNASVQGFRSIQARVDVSTRSRWAIGARSIEEARMRIKLDAKSTLRVAGAVIAVAMVIVLAKCTSSRPPEDMASTATALGAEGSFVGAPIGGAAFDIGVGRADPWVIGTDGQP